MKLDLMMISILSYLLMLVWNTRVFSAQVMSFKGHQVAYFLLQLFKQLKREDFELVCMILWLIWADQNSCIHEGKREEAAAVLEEAARWLIEFQESQASFSSSIRVQIIGPLNSVEEEGLVRDSAGFVLGAFAKTIPGAFSVFTAKCLAVREGLFFAKGCGFQVALIECDSSSVVKFVSDPASLAVKEPILADIRLLLQDVGGGSRGFISRNLLVREVL
ncbi:hypothetical protein L484_027096 [Morus notabilis]|uniref:RNase H type-1 domain-containing protein n=1 Tax=Morus notabilis TaxID=981085 RepID=W9SBI5_9ROSA|nr:hypothetical protein L484_027096 [Morus notabilis]